MENMQPKKAKLGVTIDKLSGALRNNLLCKEDDIKVNIKYLNETKYSVIFRIDYYKAKERRSKPFEITGELLPDVDEFEYEKIKIKFIDQIEFIQKVQAILNGLGASW
jgi:hypothetical protein